MKNPCPLCESVSTELYSHTKDRDFFKCNNCDLIFTSSEFLLDKDEEKKRYNQHQNNILDDGYKAFLYQVVTPIKKYLDKGSIGLDFGSGPYPALVELLVSEGYKMWYYDPYYFNNQEVFDLKYDFITLTEVAEHLYKPADIFKRLVDLLKPNAYLIIMTHRTDLVDDFKNWYYKNDETHVCFYAEKSMQYIAEKYRLKLSILNDRVAVFRKN
jgi:hypothetical protein